MEFDNVGIILTDRCNAHCAMCCSGKEDPYVQRKTLDESELDLVLSQVKACPDIKAVGITGGEPMLYPELVQHICDFDYGRDMKISIKTNGFWGGNREQAERFVAKNRSIISHISFSYDEFHRGYVSLDAIKTIIDIAQENRITTDVVGCFFADSVQPGDILNEFGDYAYKTRFEYQPVFRTGLARNFDEGRFVHLYDIAKDELICTAPLKRSVLVTSNLDLYPCCSQVAQNTILKIGNLKDKALADLMKDMQHNKLLVKMFTEGLGGLLKATDMEGECPGALSVPCEACEFLFKDARFLGRMRDALEHENHGDAVCASC